jgi:hypothetical protein
MNWSKSILALGFISVLSVTEAVAGCQISDGKLEEAVLNKQEFRGPANRQKVRDLRSLRDAAFTLWSYGLDTECEHLVATIHELVTGPPMGNLGGNDEEDADKQIAAREHKVRRETAIGHRDDKGAKPLIDINALPLGLRMDDMIGASSQLR